MKLLLAKPLTVFITLMALIFSTIGVTPAYAATIIVTTNADSGYGSLRQAILDANNTPGTDTINFAGNYTITLANSQLPTITSTIIINGNGAANTIIQAATAPNVASDRIFEVFRGDLSLNGLTVRNGQCIQVLYLPPPPGPEHCVDWGFLGGGILLDGGNLMITNSVISGNRADKGGGGIYSVGGSTLTITNSNISGNYSDISNGTSTSSGGGGIYSAGGVLIIMNSDISGNTTDGLGGGILTDYGATLTVTNSTISGNSTSGYGGGGISIFKGGTTSLTNSTLSGNSASGGGGGIDIRGGTVTIQTNSVISGNTSPGDGGGIKLDGGTLTVKNSTLSDNWTFGNGGGIYNTGGALTATNSTLSANLAVFGDGGGIYNTGSGTLNIQTNSVITGSKAKGWGAGIFSTSGAVTIQTNSTLSGNSATCGGGGIDINGGTLTLTNSTLSGNTAGCDAGGIRNYGKADITGGTFTNNSASVEGGGGIYNGATMTVTNSAFSGNTHAENGGGIYNSSTGYLEVVSSTFSANSASSSGGIFNGGTMSVTNSTLSGNSATYNGGGIGNAGALTIWGSTLSGNSADSDNGGGIDNTGTLNIANSTLSGNVSDTWGGGIDNNWGTLTLTNSTLSGNGARGGGGVHNENGGMLNFSNTIIANSGAGDCYNFANIGTNINNLVEDGSCPAALTGDPKLSALTEYGGPTQTFALLAGSPAIDAGNDGVCALWPVSNLDQRGAVRPQGIHCDIGAHEKNYTGIYYVKPVVSGTGNCLSWADACLLQTALRSSSSSIWVVQGVYQPTTGTDRTATFKLDNHVAVYGGFVGTETALDQRNPATHMTTLSGDIGFGGNSDNSYHVVTGGTGTTLDGFTITGGNANGADTNQYGGGMLNWSSHPLVINVIFLGNSAVAGGGMYNDSSSPGLINVTFNSNSATYGGGMYNNSSSPGLTNVIFSANTADDGGGLVNTQASAPWLKNVSFSNNSAKDMAGGMQNLTGSSPTLTNVDFINNHALGSDGGGMQNLAGSNPTLKNVTFSGNTAIWEGGGMSNGSSNPILTNVTFSGNTSEHDGGGMSNETSHAQIRNTIFWGNIDSSGTQFSDFGGSSTVTNVVVQDGCPPGITCANLITADPMLGTLGNYGGFTQTMPLLPGSSAINTGEDGLCPATDQRGVTRPQGTHCDIGAYESSVVATGPTFTDVPLTYWASSYIERLYNAGITGGCSATPLNYCPDSTVTRAQMAVFLLKGMHGSNFTPPAVGGSTGFSDVALNYWAVAWIKQLAAEGITGGCGTGIYCPDATVTRAQMAVFLLKAKHGSSYSPPNATGVFSDVPVSYWAASWIEQLAAEGVTSGCGAGIYCPDADVTRAQMAVFLVKAFSLP